MLNRVNLPFRPVPKSLGDLSRNIGGQGFATEAAIACLNFAFDSIKLNYVVAFLQYKTQNPKPLCNV